MMIESMTLRKRFDAYGIAENPDGTLRGKPIWFVRYAETYINLGHPDVGKLFNDNGQTLRKYNDFLFQVAVAHDAAADAAERAELERMYVLLTRHLLDQGFAAGSAYRRASSPSEMAGMSFLSKASIAVR